jgi:hypothetical protein
VCETALEVLASCALQTVSIDPGWKRLRAYDVLESSSALRTYGNLSRACASVRMLTMKNVW